MAMDLEVLDRKAAADDEVNWVTAIFMGLFHVGAIAALFFFTWKAFLVSMFLWWVSGSLGIGMGYHRLLTHRGYKTPKWIEYVLTTCAALALEGGVQPAQHPVKGVSQLLQLVIGAGEGQPLMQVVLTIAIEPQSD